MDAYLDIETTGLSRYAHEITVIGVGVGAGSNLRVTQLYDDNISAASLRDLLRGVDKVFTFNGSRFDLPFIQYRLGVDIGGIVAHQDLMFDCWRSGLRGGYKAVERTLGIARQLPSMNGYKAVLLWQDYKARNDQNALETLLAYNREDVSNLPLLQAALSRRVPIRRR